MILLAYPLYSHLLCSLTFSIMSFKIQTLIVNIWINDTNTLYEKQCINNSDTVDHDYYPCIFRDSLMNFSTGNTSSYQMHHDSIFMLHLPALLLSYTGEPSHMDFQEMNNSYLWTLHGLVNCNCQSVRLTNTEPCAYEHCNRLIG